MVIIHEDAGAPATEENGMTVQPGIDILESLIATINRRDLDGLVALFAEDVRSDTPAHPARSFVGSDQVRSNWSQILGSIDDLRATVVSSASAPGKVGDGEAIWAELAFDGHRPDGAPWQMRGVTINRVVDGRITAVQFYLEPVDQAAVDVGASIRGSVGSPTVASPAGATR
jgi:ketosteroid isomerase-like protein